MASAVSTTVTELPDSRVNVDVEVAAEEVQRSIESQARKLGREMKVPGFRTGKIPPAIVIQRIGRQALLDEAVRRRLTDWYLKAVESSGIAPVGDPKVDLGELPSEGKPYTFSFEVGVRPTATLGAYKGLEVPRREPAADPEAVDEQLEAMRERFARLEAVDRPAEHGDFVMVDYVGTIDGEPFEGGDGRDQLVEIGAGVRIDGFEEGLIGATAGETRTVEATFPEHYGVEEVAGRTAQFEFAVKEVKHKRLPALDDDFAVDSAGYETLEELRESIASELVERDRKRIEAEFRAAAVDAVVAEATVEVPDALVTARAKELIERMMHALSHQGISKEHYLRIAGKTEDELVEESKPEAEQALLREAVIEAIITAERIQPTEQELLEALGPTAEREQTTPEKLLERLREAGRLETVAKEVAAEKAIDVVVSSAKPVAPQEGADEPTAAATKRPAARRRRTSAKEQGDKASELWTPGGQAAGSAKRKLWTPGG